MSQVTIKKADMQRQLLFQSTIKRGKSSQKRIQARYRAHVQLLNASTQANKHTSNQSHKQSNTQAIKHASNQRHMQPSKHTCANTAKQATTNNHLQGLNNQASTQRAQPSRAYRVSRVSRA